MFSSNGYVSSKWGFDRGWDVNRNFIRESLPNGADYLWKTAKAWITPTRAKTQFVYLATIEPHVAYTPRRSSWSSTGTSPTRADQAGADGRAARARSRAAS